MPGINLDFLRTMRSGASMRESSSLGPSTVEGRDPRSLSGGEDDKNEMNLFSSSDTYNLGDKRPWPTDLTQTANLYSRKLMLTEEGRVFVDDIAQLPTTDDRLVAIGALMYKVKESSDRVKATKPAYSLSKTSKARLRREAFTLITDYCLGRYVDDHHPTNKLLAKAQENAEQWGLPVGKFTDEETQVIKDHIQDVLDQARHALKILIGKSMGKDPNIDPKLRDDWWDIVKTSTEVHKIGKIDAPVCFKDHARVAVLRRVYGSHRGTDYWPKVDATLTDVAAEDDPAEVLRLFVAADEEIHKPIASAFSHTSTLSTRTPARATTPRVPASSASTSTGAINSAPDDEE